MLGNATLSDLLLTCYAIGAPNPRMLYISLSLMIPSKHPWPHASCRANYVGFPYSLHCRGDAAYSAILIGVPCLGLPAGVSIPGLTFGDPGRPLRISTISLRFIQNSCFGRRRCQSVSYSSVSLRA